MSKNLSKTRVSCVILMEIMKKIFIMMMMIRDISVFRKMLLTQTVVEGSQRNKLFHI